MNLPRLKVIQLHNLHASVGGADAVLHHEAELLRSGGHEVEQLTLAAAQRSGSGLQAASKAVWNVEVCRDLDRMIDRFQPDVVHVHTPFPLMSPAVFRAARRRGIPTVATLHSYRYSCIAATCHRAGDVCEKCIGRRFKWPGITHRCYHDSLKSSLVMTSSLMLHRSIGTIPDDIDRFICLTSFARDLMLRDGFPDHKLVVKPNSVSDQGATVTLDGPVDPYIFFAGRLVDVKGVRTLLDAWKRAATENLRLVIAGAGQLETIVEQAAATDDRIEFLGWLDERAVAAKMRHAVATIVPSEWYEAGVPLVIIRSLSVGTPVIISDLDNLGGQLVQEGAATPFRTGDAAHLADVLEHADARVQELLSARPNARRAYEDHYSPPQNLRRLEAIYRGVMVG